jgi:hypothetical protein
MAKRVNFARKYSIEMNDPQGREILDRIREIYRVNGPVVDQITPLLKEFRERAVKSDNPLVTKVSRLAYEHLESYGDFLIKYIDEDLEQEVSNFEYLLQLLGDPDNKYNKEDLQEMRDYLTAYPEVPVSPES